MCDPVPCGGPGAAYGATAELDALDTRVLSL